MTRSGSRPEGDVRVRVPPGGGVVGAGDDLPIIDADLLEFIKA
jgi:hypothetical protein